MIDPSGIARIRKLVELHQRGLLSDNEVAPEILDNLTNENVEAFVVATVPPLVEVVCEFVRRSPQTDGEWAEIRFFSLAQAWLGTRIWPGGSEEGSKPSRHTIRQAKTSPSDAFTSAATFNSYFKITRPPRSSSLTRLSTLPHSRLIACSHYERRPRSRDQDAGSASSHSPPPEFAAVRVVPDLTVEVVLHGLIAFRTEASIAACSVAGDGALQGATESAVW